MIRAFWMTLCFAMAGLNGWFLIPPHHGNALNAVAAVVALGSGVFTLASLVKYP